MVNEYKYDVALSYASEDSMYVKQVAEELRKNNINLFFSEYEEIDLWGKNLYEEFINIFQNKSRYVVVFCSENYKNKSWTKHELRSAQIRALNESFEYILPAKFDDVELDGLLGSTSYIDLKKTTPSEFAKNIIDKINQRNTIANSATHTPLFLISGPSASGKDAILNDTLPLIYRNICRATTLEKCCTRELRPHEEETLSAYSYYTPEEQFLQLEKDGLFSITYQKYNNFYGFLRRDVEKKINRKTPTFVIYSDFENIDEAKQIFLSSGFNVIPILIHADIETCKNRMNRRNMSQEEIKIRNEEMVADYGLIFNKDNNIRPEISKKYKLVIRNVKNSFEESVEKFFDFVESQLYVKE